MVDIEGLNLWLYFLSNETNWYCDMMKKLLGMYGSVRLILLYT